MTRPRDAFIVVYGEFLDITTELPLLAEWQHQFSEIP
jgi:hypothetical protein